VTALQSLRDLGRLEAGQHVLVTGASGGVGSLGVAIAKRLGATVTAIGSGRGLELARRLGATHVVDRTRGDVFAAASGPFDVILDAAAAYSWRQWKSRLRPGGTFVTTLPSGRFVVDKLASLVSRSRTKFINVKARRADLELLASWLADGLEVPIDRVLPVRRVAEGLAALDGGSSVLGRIVIEVANGFEAGATAAGMRAADDPTG
jgi:NADPH:quinone reductase-like Zn-dependent oxidoreductase